MAWNEPGGGKRDPWQGKPPDLDALLKRLATASTACFDGGVAVESAAARAASP